VFLQIILKHVSPENSHFSQYLTKIREIEAESTNKNITDCGTSLNEFKRSYQPLNNLINDDNGDMLADSDIILKRWTKHFS
jgi:hypothetical protein